MNPHENIEPDPTVTKQEAAEGTCQSWALLDEIMREEGLTREMEEEVEERPTPRYSNFRRTIGYKLKDCPRSKAQHPKPEVEVNVDPLPGEVRMKEFLEEEAVKNGISPTGVFNRLKRGKYPEVKVRHADWYHVYVSREGAA